MQAHTKEANGIKSGDSNSSISNYKVYVYIVKHNYILGVMLFILRKAQLHVKAETCSLLYV
jgi:hypothetical protein